VNCSGRIAPFARRCAWCVPFLGSGTGAPGLQRRPLPLCAEEADLLRGHFLCHALSPSPACRILNMYVYSGEGHFSPPPYCPMLCGLRMYTLYVPPDPVPSVFNLFMVTEFVFEIPNVKFVAKLESDAPPSALLKKI